MPSHSENVRFIEQQNKTGRATAIIDVRSYHTNDLLGVIKWHTSTRRYAFYPGSLTSFDAAFMMEIKEKINKLMTARMQ